MGLPHCFVLTDAEAKIADDFCSETLFEFSKNVSFRDRLELVVQTRLQHPDEENPFPQTDGSGMRRDEVPDNLFPCVDYFVLAQTLAQSELLHELR